MTATRLQEQLDAVRLCGTSGVGIVSSRQPALEHLSVRLGARVTELAELQAELAALLLAPPPSQSSGGGPSWFYDKNGVLGASGEVTAPLEYDVGDLLQEQSKVELAADVETTICPMPSAMAERTQWTASPTSDSVYYMGRDTDKTDTLQAFVQNELPPRNTSSTEE